MRRRMVGGLLLVAVLVLGPGRLAPGRVTSLSGLTTALSALSVVEGSSPAAGGGNTRLTLTFVGDIRLSDKIAENISRYGIGYPWEHVGPILRSADLAFGNLETAVGTRGRPVPDKQWTFQSHPSTLPGMVAGGITVVSLANNHIGDYGPQGILDTIQHLRNAGVRFAGAGADADRAWEPLWLEKAGFKIGFISVSRIFPSTDWIAGKTRPGLASGHDETRLLRAVQSVAAQADVTIVSIHWGIEKADNPTAADRNLAHRLVKAGADLVIGHHPHVLQGFEQYEGALIAYSLGNFVFTPSADPRTADGGILVVELDREGIAGARLVPTRLRMARPELLAGDEAESVIARVSALSEEFGLSLDRTGRLLLKTLRAPGEGRGAEGDAGAPAGRFSDLTGHWARSDVEAAIAGGWVGGYPDGLFRPARAVSRAEFVKMVVAATGRRPAAGDPLPFVGVADHWAAGWVAAGVGSGFVVPGEYGGRFNPDGDITRREMVMMAVRALGREAEARAWTGTLPFRDHDLIPVAVAGYVAVASRYGIIGGYPDGTFGPEHPATRAEAVVVILRTLGVPAGN